MDSKTIYVDELRRDRSGATWRYAGSCHMFSDSMDPAELHSMADRLGLKREWFQHKPGQPWLDHYDLTASKRAEAISLGAVPVAWREAVSVYEAKRKSVTTVCRLCGQSVYEKAAVERSIPWRGAVITLRVHRGCGDAFSDAVTPSGEPGEAYHATLTSIYHEALSGSL